MTHSMQAAIVVVAALCTGVAQHLAAQAVGDVSVAKPVAGDPGMRSAVVVDDEHVRVLRNYAEPGATRRMHAHKDATFHVLTLLSGALRVTVEGEPAVDITAGQVMTLKGGVTHSFLNTGTVTATMVEVFGKAPKHR